MPATVKHVLTATTPDDPAYEIRPSHWNDSHALTLSLAGSEVSPVFSNANGASFGLSGTAVTLSYTVPVVSAFLTTAMLSNASSAFAGVGETVTTVGGTNLGLTVDTAGVQIAHPLWLTTAQPVGAYLTTARASNDAVGLNTAATQVTWTVNSSGISLNAGAYLTTAMASNAGSNFAGLGETVGTTAGTDLKMTVDSSGVNVSHPKWITTAAASDHSHGNPTLALTNLTGTTASASNGFTLSLSAAAPGAGGGAALKGSGTYTQNTGTVEFANANGITFGLSNNGTMTASHNGLTTARASNDGIGLNAAATNVTWTVNSSGISMNAAGYAGTGLTINVTNLATSATLNSNGLNLSINNPDDHFSGWTLGGNTLGTSSTGLTTEAGLNLVGGNNITLSGNSNSITIIGPTPGGGAGSTASYFSFPRAPFVGTSSITLGISSNFVQPFVLPMAVSAGFIRIPVSVAFASTAFATTANNSNRLNMSQTHFVQIYSQQGGASSQSIASAYSTSATFGLAVSYQVGGASNNQSCYHSITYAKTGSAGETFSTSYTPAGSSNCRISTTHLTAFTGALFMDIPFATVLNPGNYWLVLQNSSATATTGAGAMTNVTSRASIYNVTQVSVNMREMGANTTVGSHMIAGYGHGWWTTNTSGRTTTQMALSHISSIANHPIVPFQLMRMA